MTETTKSASGSTRYVIIEIVEPQQVAVGDEIWVQVHNCWMKVGLVVVDYRDFINETQYIIHGTELLDGSKQVASFFRFDLIPKVKRWVEAK
jgi:hypothetical protein